MVEWIINDINVPIKEEVGIKLVNLVLDRIAVFEYRDCGNWVRALSSCMICYCFKLRVMVYQVYKIEREGVVFSRDYSFLFKLRSSGIA